MGAAALVLSSQRVEGPGRRRALPETLLGTSRAYLVDCTSEAHVRRMRETSEDPTLAEVATALAALFEEVRIVRPCAHTRPSLPPPPAALPLSSWLPADAPKRRPPLPSGPGGGATVQGVSLPEGAMNMLGAPKQPMVGVIDSIHLSTARDRHVVPRTPGEGGGGAGPDSRARFRGRASVTGRGTADAAGALGIKVLAKVGLSHRQVIELLVHGVSQLLLELEAKVITYRPPLSGGTNLAAKVCTRPARTHVVGRTRVAALPTAAPRSAAPLATSLAHSGSSRASRSRPSTRSCRSRPSRRTLRPGWASRWRLVATVRPPRTRAARRTGANGASTCGEASRGGGGPICWTCSRFPSLCAGRTTPRAARGSGGDD